MPRKLLIASAFLVAGCTSIDVKAPPVIAGPCPAVAPSLPCSAPQSSPETLSELRRAQLEAEAAAANCKALADEWMRRWRECADDS